MVESGNGPGYSGGITSDVLREWCSGIACLVLSLLILLRSVVSDDCVLLFCFGRDRI